MPTFKSINGEWFPQDEETKAELAAHGLDHLGIHVAEDPYIKNLEYVTGIPRKDLVGQNQQLMMNQMQLQMLKTQQAMVMALAGDQEGARRILAEIKTGNPSGEISKPIDDKQAMQKEEFEKTMKPGKAKTAPPKGKLPHKFVNKPKVNQGVENHAAVAAGVKTGFGKLQEE